MGDFKPAERRGGSKCPRLQKFSERQQVRPVPTVFGSRIPPENAQVACNWKLGLTVEDGLDERYYQRKGSTTIGFGTGATSPARPPMR